MKRFVSIIFVFLILVSTSVFAEPVNVNSDFDQIALTDEDKFVRTNFSELNVIMKVDRYPYSYYEDGEYQGIYVDYLKEISEKSGIRFNYVPYESDEQLEPYFTLGKTDALIATYGSWQGLYRTTNPYSVVEYNLVAPPDTDIMGVKQHVVAVSSTDVMLQNYLKEKYPDWEIEKYNNVRASLRAVNRGKADMTFVTALDLQLNYSLLSYSHIEVADELSLYIPVSLAISDVSCPDVVINYLNKYIECTPIRSDDRVRRKYILNYIYMPNILEYFLIHKEIIVFVFIVILLLIISTIVRMRRMRIKLERDSLTGLWNQRKFVKEAGKRLKDGRNTEYLLAVLDVERFKLINDRFGIHVGNHTLKTIANNIRILFRGSGIFGRSTSDKFVVLVADTPRHRELLDEMANMDVKINNATYYQVPIKVGVCPICQREMGDMDVTNIMDRAKIVNAKIKGHQDIKISYFTKSMGEKLAKENELETIMRKSLKNKEFVVYYQPKYDLKSNKIIGAEALVRWQHPTKGLISPGDFIPLFEKNGFIVEVDFYVYETVMQTIRKRLDKGKPIVPISMNVSRCHLSSSTFTKHLEELAEKYSIPKETIEMEITESIFSDEDKAAVELMEDLKRHNFTLSMDDFGSGYSSLNLLRELPIDTLKIDKGFLEQTDESPRGRVIVEEIIQMATKIDIRTICEGVETEQQRDFLKDAGCNMAQGFFYARPMPQSDFEELLDKEN